MDLSVAREYTGVGSPSSPLLAVHLFESSTVTRTAWKCLNNLGKSQMLGGPEFPKPNICLYDSQIIQ